MQLHEANLREDEADCCSPRKNIPQYNYVETAIKGGRRGLMPLPHSIGQKATIGDL